MVRTSSTNGNRVVARGDEEGGRKPSICRQGAWQLGIVVLKSTVLLFDTSSMILKLSSL